MKKFALGLLALFCVCGLARANPPVGVQATYRAHATFTPYRVQAVLAPYHVRTVAVVQAPYCPTTTVAAPYCPPTTTVALPAPAPYCEPAPVTVAAPAPYCPPTTVAAPAPSYGCDPVTALAPSYGAGYGYTRTFAAPFYGAGYGYGYQRATVAVVHPVFNQVQVVRVREARVHLPAVPVKQKTVTVQKTKTVTAVRDH